ncbi:MAG: DsbA family protein [Myxococcales bacterium]|nr:DsbA family protein [Myxococcales bacterium]
MSRVYRPFQVLVYHDVLCAWCYLADQRLASLREELKDLVRWRYRPYPLRALEAQPTQAEIEDRVKELIRARNEAGGEKLSCDLWTTGDPPRSSVSPLAALEAAKLQGSAERVSLWRAMQRAALEQGVNVTRSDVVYELASRLGLNMNRFVAAYQSPETRRLILEEHRLASSRGVRGVPAVVLGGRWMIRGLREVSEYRELVLSCVQKAGMTGYGAPLGTVH